MTNIEEIAKTIVHAAVKVHSTLGPGLLESAYQKCMDDKLKHNGLDSHCEVLIPIHYGTIRIDAGYRVDMLINRCVIVENKTVEKILPIHEAQLLTYLKLQQCKLGFILNWNVARTKDGIKRMVNGL